VPLVLVPSGVQGAAAAGEIRAALRTAVKLPDVDVIILARGGGSPEDLWCFNDEALAREVAACPIPTVSGVGHEIDFTLCDYAADVRASTPSNAAEIVFPDRKELRSRVALLRSGLGRSMTGAVSREQLRTGALRQRLQRLLERPLPERRRFQQP
jgi:exodeoxyribonuclease VII large subunit